jgi:hypothetical protein
MTEVVFNLGFVVRRDAISGKYFCGVERKDYRSFVAVRYGALSSVVSIRHYSPTSGLSKELNDAPSLFASMLRHQFVPLIAKSIDKYFLPAR